MSLASRLGFTRIRESTFLPFQQFAGGGVDSDDGDYRPLTQVNGKDLAPLAHQRILQLAYYLYRSNPLARRIVEITKDFVVGDGLTISGATPEIDAVIQAHWQDSVNNWHCILHQRVIELSLYGELILPAFVNQINGHLRLGVIDPLAIQQVVMDPDNVQVPIGLIVGSAIKKRKYQVILQDAQTVSDKAVALRKTYSDGEAFYFAVNKISTATRGGSDLESLIELLDHFDRLHFDIADRVAFLNAFVWDVTLEGADQTRVNEWLKKHQTPPKPGTVRGHNEREKWSPISPDIKSAEIHELVRMVKSYILAGAGIPEHWISEGMDITRATASAAHAPVIRRLKTRQSYVLEMIRQILEYQVRRAIEPAPGVAGPLATVVDDDGMVTTEAGEQMSIRDALTVSASVISPHDLAAAASTLVQTATGLATAITDKTIDRGTAVQVLAAVLQGYGVTMDVERVLASSEESSAGEQHAVEVLYERTAAARRAA